MMSTQTNVIVIYLLTFSPSCERHAFTSGTEAIPLTSIQGQSYLLEQGIATDNLG